MAASQNRDVPDCRGSSCRSLGLIGLGLCVVGLLVLLDPHGGPNLLASIYELLGNTAGATDLRNG